MKTRIDFKNIKPTVLRLSSCEPGELKTLEDELKEGDKWGGYTDWEFVAFVAYDADNNSFYAEIHRHQSYIDTIIADTLEEMKAKLKAVKFNSEDKLIGDRQNNQLSCKCGSSK